MAIDVSVYELRIDDGYLTTVAGGTVRSKSESAYSGAVSSGGSAATGTVKVTGDQRISGTKYFDASTNFTYDVSIGGSLIVSGSQTISGDESITNNLTVGNDASISGNLWVSGDINGGLFGSDVEITNNLTVGNDVSISGNLYVDGSTFQQDVTVIESSTYNWHVLNDASIDNDLKVGNDATISGTLTATTLTVNAYANLFTTTVSDDFDVLGNSTFNGDVSITGNLYVDGNAFGGTYATLTYVDGSLATRDAYMLDVSTRIPTDFYSQAYVDGSLNNKADNSDIPTDFYSQAYVDGSLSTLDTYIDDVSLRLSNVDVDVSLSNLSDVSINNPSDADILRYNSSQNKWTQENTTDITGLFQSVAIENTPDSSAYGIPGDMAYDASYFYICTEASTWIRFLGEGGY